MIRYFLFDLDGTLTDTGEGIRKSVQYALDVFQLYNQPEKDLNRFIGPPLIWSFQTYYGFPKEVAEQAVAKYRERYKVQGVYENQLYDGIKKLLQELSQKATLCVATSKPVVFAKQILEMRGIQDNFTVVVGAELDGTRNDKAEVIKEVLRQLENPDVREVMMIGDRLHDVEGAKKLGIPCIGVRYGFSTGKELEEAGAKYVVESVEELRRLCFSLVQE